VERLTSIALCALVLTACQTTGGYTWQTVQSYPTRASGMTEAEYAVTLAAYKLPRECHTVRYTSHHRWDPQKSGDVTRFHVGQIHENSLGNGWHKVAVTSVSASGFVYANSESGNFVCGKKNWQSYATRNGIQGTWNLVKIDVAKTLAKANDMSTASNESQESDMKGDTRPIAVSWEGYETLIAGTATLVQRSGEGALNLNLPKNEGKCTGQYVMKSRNGGIWSVACTNGLAANGEFTSHGKGKGASGEGKDVNGKKVTYTIGKAETGS